MIPKIILIDDEDFLNDAVAGLLEALSPSTEVESLIELPSENLFPERRDIVICDLKLASGTVNVNRLAELFPNAKIYIHSGYSREFINSKVFNKKLTYDCLEKPVQLETWRQLLKANGLECVGT